MTALPMGLRLAIGGDRSARVRLALMAGGVAAAVALLLGVAGAGPAALDRLERESSRSLAFDQQGPSLTDGVRAETTVGRWRGQELRVLDVEVVGAPVSPPAGVPALPAPGEVLVSPALADALQGPRAGELTPRLHGEVVGRIGPAGLLGPDELFAVSGALPGELHGDLARGFGTAGPQLVSDGITTVTEGVSDGLRPVLLIAGVGLVVPLVVLVGTATRLSAAGRERRTAALRLVGATARQVAALGGIEGALVGLLGAAVGTASFFLLRAPVAALVPVPAGLFPGDVSPPAWATLLVLGGVPLLAAVVGVLAVRRASSSPLAIRRQALPPTPGLGRLLPLALGLCLLVGSLALRSAVLSGRWYGAALLVSGAALCLIGLAIAGPALARAAGLLLARFGPGPASQLAGRRLAMDPSAAARTVTGTALVVVVVGWLLAFLPLMAASTPGGRGVLAEDLQPATVVAGFPSDATPTRALERVGRLPGVGPVVPVGFVQLQRPGAPLPSDWPEGQVVDPSQFPLNAVVVDCTALNSVLREPLAGCAAGGMYRLSGPNPYGVAPAAGRYEVLGRGGATTGDTLDLPTQLPSLAMPDGLAQGIDGFGLGGDVLLTSMPGSAAPVDAVLVGTDGKASTIEAVRAGLGEVRTPFAPMTPEEATVVARSGTEGYTRAAMSGLALVVLVGGLSLAVTTAEGLRERRAAHAALTAMGIRAGVLRRSVLLQTASPLVLGVGLALGISAAGSWLYLRLGTGPDEPPAPALPWAEYGAVGVGAVLASLLATAAVLPFVRSAVRPESLRFE